MKTLFGDFSKWHFSVFKRLSFLRKYPCDSFWEAGSHIHNNSCSLSLSLSSRPGSLHLSPPGVAVKRNSSPGVPLSMLSAPKLGTNGGPKLLMKRSLRRACSEAARHHSAPPAGQGTALYCQLSGCLTDTIRLTFHIKQSLLLWDISACVLGDFSLLCLKEKGEKKLVYCGGRIQLIISLATSSPPLAQTNRFWTFWKGSCSIPVDDAHVLYIYFGELFSLVIMYIILWLIWQHPNNVT